MRQWRLGKLRAPNSHLGGWNQHRGEGEILRMPFLISVCTMPSRKPSTAVCLLRPGSSWWALCLVVGSSNTLIFSFFGLPEADGIVSVVGICKNPLRKMPFWLFGCVTWVLAAGVPRTGRVWVSRGGSGCERGLCKRRNFCITTLLRFLFLPVQNLGRPYWLTLAPMYIWMLIFFSQPHKEERFLFPIYPLICLSGAVALSALQVTSSGFW